MSYLVLARNCCLVRMLPGEAENGVGMNRCAREGKKSVKRFDGSSGPDTALYKNYLYLLCMSYRFHSRHPCIPQHKNTYSRMSCPYRRRHVDKGWKHIRRHLNNSELYK